MQKIVKIPDGLPVAPGITEIFSQVFLDTPIFYQKLRNLLNILSAETETVFLIFFLHIKSDDIEYSKWPEKTREKFDRSNAEFRRPFFINSRKLPDSATFDVYFWSLNAKLNYVSGDDFYV